MLLIVKTAAEAGVGIDTVRFYERAEASEESFADRGKVSLYHTDDVTRLRLIQRARALGFSLEEIKELFALNDGVGRRKSVRAIAERRLHELQQRSRSLIECSERLLTSSANAMAMVH